MRLILLKKSFFVFASLFFTLYCNAQTFVGPGTDWNTASNWAGGVVPSNSFSTTITINANVNVASITVKSGGTLIVNSPAILTVGTSGNSANTQVVDFQNGSNVVVNTGASMKVYGKLNNSNNSDSVKFDGAVSVDGNVTVGNGSTITGSGSLSSTGSVSGAGYVFGTTDDCNSGCNYSCSTTAPTGITGTTTICNGNSTTLTLSGGTAGGATAKWYTGSCGGTLVGTGTSVTVSPTTNTVYYVRYEGTCNTTTCASTTVTVNTLSIAPTSITGTTTICNGSSTTLTLSGGTAGTGAIAQWYSGSCGGTLVGTGNSVTVTPTSNTAYYVRYSGTCNTTSCASATVTVTPTSVGGTISGGTTPICQGASTGTLTLSGYVGTIIQWERRVNSGSWSSVGNYGSTTYSEIPYSGGIWEYRALVQNGGCTSAYSSIQTIVVNQTPVGGGVYSGNTPICLNSSTGNMTLGGGYVGTIVRWEKRLNSGSWTSISNTANVYSENPSVAGTWEYRAVVGSGNCPEVYSSAFSVVVNSAMTITLTSTNTSVCQTTTTATLSYTATTGSPSQWAIDFDSSANAAGFSDQTSNLAVAPGTITVNVPYGVNTGVYNGMLTVINYYPSCVSTSYPISVTVTSLSPPTAGTPTNPSCKVPTGSVPLSGLPSSGTIVQTGERIENIVITGGGSQTITGLIPGTYYFAVTNGSCTSATVSVVIVAPTTNTWSTGSWSTGTPTINQRLVFATDYTNANDVDIEGCSCQVTGSAAVTIKSGRTLKIENGIEVQPNATLTFENNASLVQINDDAVNSGSIIYKRKTPNLNRYDFTYWSSPVVGTTLNALSPATLFDKYYSYNPDLGWEASKYGVLTMTKGNGYIIRAPQNYAISGNPQSFEAIFNGTPHNGKIEKILAANKVYLLGNPYPSAIDADAFLTENASKLEGTLYFWTHNSPPSSTINGDFLRNYTANDYATYNRTGGVSTASAAYTGIVAPTGKIAAGQGFFAPASTAGGTVVFNNSMRLSATGTLLNNSQFFKLSSSSKSDLVVVKTEKNRLWLNLTNKQGAFKQMLIGYITGASNDYDGGFDGVTYDGNKFVDFYSVNNAVNLSIQGRALPFEKKDSVALGYKSTIKGEFQISIDHTDGVLSSQSIFVEDKVLNVLHDLKKGAYTFTTEIGSFNNRFVLRYVDKNASEEVVEPEVPEVLHKEVLVSVQNDVITVNSPIELLKVVVVYDVTGKKIYQKSDIDANELLVEHLKLSHQVLVVDVFLSNGTKINKKIVY